MTTRLEVSCITPDTTNDVDRRIDSIGGAANGGWTMHVDDVIRALDENRYSFFVRGNALLSSPAEVVTRAGLLRRYVTTVADGKETNNLQNLPRCPTTYRRVA